MVILANVLGLVLGYVLSLILVYVINKQSFGWTIQFHWPVAVLLGSLEHCVCCHGDGGAVSGAARSAIGSDGGGA